MKRYNFFTNLAGGLVLLLVSCSQPSGPWADFTKCATNACVREAIAVNEALIKDPKGTLGQFQKTYEKGEDHVVGWLYLMRDSVLFNSKYGSTQERFALQQRIIQAVQPFGNDPKLGETAKVVLTEIQNLAIILELEEGPEASEEQMLTGTYAIPNLRGGSAELMILATGDESARFRLMVVGGPPAHNQGMLEGTAMMKGNVLEMKTSEFGGTCVITAEFRGDTVVVKTVSGGASECGFGNGVVADGVYIRVDDLDPFRTEGGDEAPAELEGKWQSISDPKSEIIISNGKFLEQYEGKEMFSESFSYHKTCPGDCGESGGEACIRIVGQDIICHTVVQLDKTTLSLSMVGGRGNTNTYKRK